MLTPLEATRRRPSPPPSLTQQYQEYVLQRIEQYKNSLSRAELLRLGDEATSELQAAREGQLVLTEVMMLDAVDRLIQSRLRLKSYRQWRTQHLKLRAAQRELSHWGLDANHPVAAILARLEPGDQAMVIGRSAEGVALLLAAHDTPVVFLDDDLGAVERVESRMAAESLTASFEAWVVDFAQGWLPDTVTGPVHLVAIDTDVLSRLAEAARARFVSLVQWLSAPEAVHLVLPVAGALPAESFLSLYDGWVRETGGGRRGAPAGLALSRACRSDTPEDSAGVSARHAAPDDLSIAN